MGLDNIGPLAPCFAKYNVKERIIAVPYFIKKLFQPPKVHRPISDERRATQMGSHEVDAVECRCASLAVLISRLAGRKGTSATSTDPQVGGGLPHESHPPNFSAFLNLPARCLPGPHPSGIPSGLPRKHLAGSPNPASSLGPPGHLLTGPWLPPLPKTASVLLPVSQLRPMPLAPDSRHRRL